MRRAALLVAVLLPLSACGGGPPLPEEDLLLGVSAGAREVATGRGFPLTVVRVWSKDLEPSAWEDRALAPLVLRLEATERREDDRRVEETRRYRAYAMSLGDLTVPAVKFVARSRAGGAERATSSARFRLRVTPTLDPALPGAPEWPGEPLEEPFSWAPWAIAVGAVAVALALVRGRRRAPAASGEPAPPAPAAHLAALERLEAVSSRRSSAPGDVRADVAETSEILREYVARRFAVPTRERTSEEAVEALRASRAHDVEAAPRLASLFRRCDVVKYAAHAPTIGEREVLLRDAAAFVTATKERAASGTAADGRGVP